MHTSPTAYCTRTTHKTAVLFALLRAAPAQTALLFQAHHVVGALHENLHDLFGGCEAWSGGGLSGTSWPRATSSSRACSCQLN